jgi:hypothetical protein
MAGKTRGYLVDFIVDFKGGQNFGDMATSVIVR